MQLEYSSATRVFKCNLFQYERNPWTREIAHQEVFISNDRVSANQFAYILVGIQPKIADNLFLEVFQITARSHLTHHVITGQLHGSTFSKRMEHYKLDQSHACQHLEPKWLEPKRALQKSNGTEWEQSNSGLSSWYGMASLSPSLSPYLSASPSLRMWSVRLSPILFMKV